MSEKVRTMTLLVLATISGMSLWFMTAAILPDIVADAGISAAQASILSSAVQAGFAAGALAIAISGLADRLDPRRVFVFCAVGTALANAMLLWIDLAGWMAVSLRFLTGALMAGVYPIGMKIAVGWGLRDRGLLVGILVAALTFGNALPYGLAWLGGADWQIALIATSGIAGIGGLLVLGTTLGPHHAQASRFQAKAVMLAITTPSIRAAYLGYLGHMWELFALWAWVGVASAASYSLHMHADQAQELGKLTAFLTVALGAPACVVAGVFADRIGKARVAVLAMVASASFAVLTALTFGGLPAITFILFILWGIAVIPDSAQFSALVADFAPPEWAGSLLTLQTALGFLLTVLTVQVAPLIAENFGWPTLLAILAIGPALGILGMVPLLKVRA